jgi:hypothetical protein
MIRTMDRSSSITRPSPRTVSGGMALAGTALVSVGVVLPWLSFFAGLQPITAVGTLNGTFLFIGAAASGLLGVVVLARGSNWARRGLAMTGIGLSAFSAYLAVQFIATYREVSADPLLVAQPGPGLVLVVIGALLVLATAFIGD